jgi:hypothetical protein
VVDGSNRHHEDNQRNRCKHQPHPEGGPAREAAGDAERDQLSEDERRPAPAPSSEQPHGAGGQCGAVRKIESGGGQPEDQPLGMQRKQLAETEPQYRGRLTKDQQYGYEE